jgi:hypothetical protein
VGGNAAGVPYHLKSDPASVVQLSLLASQHDFSIDWLCRDSLELEAFNAYRDRYETELWTSFPGFNYLSQKHRVLDSLRSISYLNQARGVWEKLQIFMEPSNRFRPRQGQKLKQQEYKEDLHSRDTVTRS